MLRAGDLTAAATPARCCRPDLMLLPRAWSGGLPPDRRERFPDSPLGWLLHGLRRRIAAGLGRDPIAAVRGRGYRLV